MLLASTARPPAAPAGESGRGVHLHCARTSRTQSLGAHVLRHVPHAAGRVPLGNERNATGRSSAATGRSGSRQARGSRACCRSCRAEAPSRESQARLRQRCLPVCSSRKDLALQAAPAQKKSSATTAAGSLAKKSFRDRLHGKESLALKPSGCSRCRWPAGPAAGSSVATRS